MRLRDLFDGRFGDYFSSAGSTDLLWTFVHVPKTAGTSLNTELNPSLSPRFHIHVDYSKFDPAVPGCRFHELLDFSVNQFIASAQHTHYRYCTGHVRIEHLMRITASVPNVRPFTFLRDPVTRYVSDYRYQRTPMHPGNEAFREHFPTIQHWMKETGEQNKMARFLIPESLRQEKNPEAMADFLLDTYAFIGTIERYPLSFQTLTALMGKKRSPVRRERTNPPNPETDVVLTPELKAQIRKLNRIDVALYQAIASRFTLIAPELRRFLQERQSVYS